MRGRRVRRTGRVPEFEWEKREEFDKSTSEYKKFSITVESSYEWGKGWTKEDSELFYRELSSKIKGSELLKDLAFKEHDSGSCPTLVGKRISDKTNIYMHPMEFSGYAKDGVIDEMVSLLNSMDIRNTRHAYIAFKREVSGMSNSEYKNLLVANIGGIARWQDAAIEAGYSWHDLGPKFAECFRIRRVGDRSGLSPSDVDWSFVEDLWRIREGLENYNKEKEGSASIAPEKDNVVLPMQNYGDEMDR